MLLKSIRHLLGLFIVAILLGPASPPLPVEAQDGFNRRVLVINSTGTHILALFASRVTTAHWEEDILGQDVLPAGTAVRVDFNDGSGSCLFDIKAKLFNGDTRVRTGVNVCAISELYLY